MSKDGSSRLRRWAALCGIAIFVLCGLVASPATAAEHQLGVGVHYWQTVDDINEDFDDIEGDGYGIVASYRYQPGRFLFFQVDVDYFADGFGGSDDTSFAPVVLIGTGRTFYAALGVGATVANDFDGNLSDFFFLGRVGYELDLLQGVSIDIYADYQSGAFAWIENFESDTTTLGAVVRFTL